MAWGGGFQGSDSIGHLGLLNCADAWYFAPCPSSERCRGSERENFRMRKMESADQRNREGERERERAGFE